ncbi:MAG TPA: sugar ABC transporter permease, partial [Ruminococcaceae bacterium]|nr:sugar ABC transporter permease [Oscillospiraceae bacterium]
MNRKSKLNSKYQPIAYAFVAPFILGTVTFFIYALTVSLQFSFAAVSTGSSSYELNYVGFNNYKYAFLTDTQFVRRMVTSLIELVTNTPIILIFSLFTAVLLNQNMPGRTFFRAVFFLPVIVATGIIADADANNTVLQVLSS